jgi:hypothetical protein
VVLADSNTEVAVSPAGDTARTGVAVSPTGDTARTGARLGPDPEVAVSPTGDTARTGARLGPARTGSDRLGPEGPRSVSRRGHSG